MFYCAHHPHFRCLLLALGNWEEYHVTVARRSHTTSLIQTFKVLIK